MVTSGESPSGISSKAASDTDFSGTESSSALSSGDDCTTGRVDWEAGRYSSCSIFSSSRNTCRASGRSSLSRATIRRSSAPKVVD